MAAHTWTDQLALFVVVVCCYVLCADWSSQMRRAWLSGVAWDSTRDCPHDLLSKENVLAWHALHHPDAKVLELVSCLWAVECHAPRVVAFAVWSHLT